MDSPRRPPRHHLPIDLLGLLRDLAIIVPRSSQTSDSTAALPGSFHRGAASATLHQIVAGSGRAVPPPAAGLLLSERLADLLDVRAGDAVEAEVLEGRRATYSLPVTGLVDDLLGVSAYMSLPALNELLSEGPAISGAFLDVDPAQEQQVFARLRRAPKVAGVSLRSAALASFHETSGQIVLAFAGVLVLFAAGIAAGIVYNTGRVALAERERELATLRVLGFTRGETWRVLAGEIGAHLALGIPAGCLWGLGLAAAATAVFDSDLFRLPVVVTPRSYLTSAAVVAATALGVLVAVRSRLGRLDLVAVPKARE
jgi:putative ABC transport system permease protein